MSITLVTPRDRDILLALDRCPLTVRQLLRLSATFAYPFTTERRVQERLATLCAAGHLRRHYYATTGPGMVSHFTLSPTGYRILHGHDVPLPRSHVFASVAVARQTHTLALADFIVHTALGARRIGVSMEHFRRENTQRLQAGTDHLYPDCAFQLVAPGRLAFHYFVELDNSTERLQTDKDADSWDRKIRLYERYADTSSHRFRVLVVSTRSHQRQEHILAMAGAHTGHGDRSLFYGIPLASYLAEPDPIHAPCFRNHRGQPVALIRRLVSATVPPTPASQVWYNRSLPKPPSDVRVASSDALSSPPIASFQEASGRGAR